jgi:hypothetical protein
MDSKNVELTDDLASSFDTNIKSSDPIDQVGKNNK